MGTKIFLGFIVSIFFLIFTSETHAMNGPLRVSPQNPRYFTDNSGKAIYMTGSHTWDNLVDMISPSNPTPFNFTNYLNFLQANNHNFIRLWAWELTKSTYNGLYLNTITVSPHPWVRSGPGTALDGLPKFNLTQLNQAYYDRMRQRIIAAGSKGIYVSVMLFEGHGMAWSNTPWNWDGHPFHPSNNVSGIDGQRLKVHSLDNPAVTALQDAYVRKVIDTVNDLDNVLYEIVNEDASNTIVWQEHMISLIRSYEQNKSKKHPVGVTIPATGGSNATLFNSSADWISPNGDGGYKDNPPAATGNKVILSDTDHLWGIGGNVDWVWKTFLQGMNPLFMDSMIETWSDGVIKAMGNTLTYANKMNLVSMTPQRNLTSTSYALASIGNEYLVYQPGTGGFTVSLSSGTYTYEWFNVGTRSIATTGLITASGSTTFAPPFSGPAVLYLKRTSQTQTPTPTPTRTPTSTPVPTPDPSGWTKVDERDNRVTYTGFWNQESPDGGYLNTQSYTSQQGDSATFTFTGTGVRLYTKHNYNHGQAKVFVDGVYQTTIDTYAAVAQLQVLVFEKTGLSTGPHTLRMENVATTGRPYIVTDVFSYTQSSTTIPKPGDANGDNRVDGLDYIVWLTHYGQNVSGANNGNFNGDARVDGLDYVVWLTNYGR